ncbi:MAG: aspartate carbamoyltransferase [Bacteroidetes bacterium]|nr:MAG: aspartate carbamoyltransferase [Bacteroidota bacterium]
MNNRSLISINDYSKEEILQVLKTAEEFEANPRQKILKNHVIASLFFEPSTRTRLSFESAINQLGGRIIGFTDASSSSVKKGESLRDTIETVSLYSDLIVMRHPLEGSARFASEINDTPVINAGDGANQHPTQCLLDLYSIKQTQNRLDNLDIALVGDLKYGRTVHSLVIAMSMFKNIRFHLVSPIELKLPRSIKDFIVANGHSYKQYTDISAVINNIDILYMTRIQQERFADQLEYERVKNSYVLENSMLDNSRDNLRILHPMPRVNEIDENVDSNKKAHYFQQAQNGVFVRQALLATILGLR